MTGATPAGETPGSASALQAHDPSATPSPDLLQYHRDQQLRLASRVAEIPLAAGPRLIAAVDMHLRTNHGIASVVLMRYPDFDVVEEHVVAQDIDFPYIPGLLTVREAPISLAAIHALARLPDLLLVDGHGRAHPRRAGIACYLGVELGIPTIGVAKSILIGHYGGLGSARGSVAPLLAGDEAVGTAVRTRAGVSPVYVSVGHLITLEEAVEWTLRAAPRYRLPEPSRRAHRLAQDAAQQLGR